MALGIPVELQSSCSICVFVGVHQSSSLACLVLDLEIEIIHVFLLAGLVSDVLRFLRALHVRGLSDCEGVCRWG